MALIVSEPKGTVYIPAPAELQQAICCDIVDKGYMDGPWGPKPKLQIRWFSELSMPPEHVGEDGIPNYMITGLYTASLHEKAALRKLLTAWRGKPFTSDELQGFDVETVLGARCLINVTHNQKQDRTYANVESITPLMRGMEKMDVPKGYVRAKDRPDWKEPPKPIEASHPDSGWSEEPYDPDNDPDDLPF